MAPTGLPGRPMTAAPNAPQQPGPLNLPLTPGERLRRLLRLQVYYAFFATLHWTLGYFFLVAELRLPIAGVILVAGTIYLTAFLLVLVLPIMEARWTLRIGFLCRIMAILPYWLWPELPGIIIGSIFFGFAMVLFWVPYNLIFFEHRARTTNAGISAVYSAVQPALDVVAALAAGWLVLQWGFPALFAVATVIGLIGWLATFRLRPRAAVRVDPWRRLARLKGLRGLIFVDGIGQGVVWVAVPLVTLFLIQDVFAFASFFAFLGVAGAIGAIIMGRISDRRAKRFVFIWPVAALVATANLLSVFAVGSIVFWSIVRGVAAFSVILLDPFRNAVLLDNASTVEDLYIGREFLLNGGRVLGVAMLLLVFFVAPMQVVFVVPAVVALALPVLIVVRGLYPEERVIFKPIRAMFRQ